MSNRQIHWFEAKQLDRVTNFSTEIEVIKAAIRAGVPMTYYCTFKETKVYFGLNGHIRYLGRFKNRYLKSIEFQLLVVVRNLKLVLSGSNHVIIVNQDLVKHVLPALFINKLFRKENKFVIDIRTTPTDPDSFQADMKRFHRSFKKAVNYFDGLSFITPFMEKYLMKDYQTKKPTVHWSSGVDIELFDPKRYPKSEADRPFIIFYHGGISESRGNLSLIKACEKLVSKGYKIELLQIGICVDKSIPNYISDQKIHTWCKLLPAIPLGEIPQIISEIDLPVLPFPDFLAWRVSSPIKLMEYLAMGKKVLAPRIEAFTDVFKDRSDLIFYFESGNANQMDELSDKIAEIIDADFLKKVDRQACIDFVSSTYTWDKQANHLIDFCIRL